jgi:exosortase
LRIVEDQKPVTGWSRNWALRAAGMALSWLALYHDVLRRLVDDWRVDENYSHGFLIPLISAYAIWSSRDRLAATPREPHLLLGGFLMTIAVWLLFAGVLGAELFITRISMALSLVALTLYFCGVAWLRQLIFPIGLLLLAIPIPNIIFNQIALPLQLIASDYATRVIKLFGVPALREGNVIELAQMKLQVVEACSGIRSLVSLTTLAVVYTYFMERKWRRRVMILAAVIPIAIIANAARVAGIGLMAHYRGIQAAENFMHSFSGWLVFLVAVGLMIAVSPLLSWLERIFRRRDSSTIAKA